MIRDRASRAQLDARQRPSASRGAQPRELPRTAVPTFQSRAQERAADLAGELVQAGHGVADGAFLAVDPRDRAGADLAIAELVREGVTARQAEWALSRAIAEAARQDDVVVGISWCDAASLCETVAGIDADASWPARLSAPIPAGVVRLLTLSDGRLALSLVPFRV